MLLSRDWVNSCCTIGTIKIDRINFVFSFFFVVQKVSAPGCLFVQFFNKVFKTYE